MNLLGILPGTCVQLCLRDGKSLPPFIVLLKQWCLWALAISMPSPLFPNRNGDVSVERNIRETTPSGKGKKSQRVECEKNLNYFLFSSCSLERNQGSRYCQIMLQKICQTTPQPPFPNFYLWSLRKAFIKLPFALLKRRIMETCTSPSKGHSVSTIVRHWWYFLTSFSVSPILYV